MDEIEALASEMVVMKDGRIEISKSVDQIEIDEKVV